MIIRNAEFIINWPALNTFKKLQVFYTCGTYSQQLWNMHAE